jgi:hypothetical protein
VSAPAWEPWPRSWVLELPQTKPMNLNHRDIWPVKAKKTAEYVEATILMVRDARVPPLGRISVLLVYGPRDRRVRDPLNLVPTLKAVEDGVVRAGVVPDDNPLYVESVMPKVLEAGGPNSLGGRLWVIITELLGDTPD